MPVPIGASFTFADYTVEDVGVRAHFVCTNPGPGNANDYFIVLSDAELAGAQTTAQLVALAQGKINRLFANADLSAKLDLLIGQSLTLAASPGADPSPVSGFPCTFFVTPWTAQSLGVELAAHAVTAPTSTAWGTNNLARIVPFVMPKPARVLKMFWHNGATAAGNVDIGIYDESGNRVVSSGSTAQTGTNVLQEVNTTDVTLGIGRYYLALAASNTTATFFAVAPSVQFLKAMGCAQQAVFPLPASGAPVALGAAVLPYCGLSLRALVV